MNFIINKIIIFCLIFPLGWNAGTGTVKIFPIYFSNNENIKVLQKNKTVIKFSSREFCLCVRVEEGTCPVLTEFSKGVKYRFCESELAVFILG